MAGDPDRTEQILEQLRARSTWQAQSPTTPHQAEVVQRSGSNVLVYALLGIGAALLLLLFVSAGGNPGGAGGGDLTPGRAASAVAPERAAAEAAGRFWLALASGDPDAVESLIDPVQRPVSSDVLEALAYAREQWEASGMAPSIGWREDTYVLEFVVADPEPAQVRFAFSPRRDDGNGYEIGVEIAIDGEVADSGVMRVIPDGDAWVVETVDGYGVQDFLAGYY